MDRTLLLTQSDTTLLSYVPSKITGLTFPQKFYLWFCIHKHVGFFLSCLR